MYVIIEENYQIVLPNVTPQAYRFLLSQNYTELQKNDKKPQVDKQMNDRTFVNIT
jgi:hypothetical protein